MRTSIDIFDAGQEVIGELTIGLDTVRGEDALDRQVVYFCADIFVDDEEDAVSHIDASILLDLIQRHYRELAQSAGTFTLSTAGDIEYDDAFTLYDEEDRSVVFSWGLATPLEMTVMAYPAYFETGLLTSSQPFEVLVITKQLYACLLGLFLAQ